MPQDYLLGTAAVPTPQSEPLRPDQVENNARGFAWAVDEWTRLRRFLILGSEGGSYYASEHDLTRENLSNLHVLAMSDGIEFVNEIVAVSVGGRAPSNDPALYALAVAMTHGDKATKRKAAESLPEVARIGTHLFHFVAYLDSMRGWGKTAKWAINNWYASKPADRLAYDVVKYAQRDGVSHRDVLRLGHPRPVSDGHRAVFEYVSRNVGHETGVDEQNRVVRRATKVTQFSDPAILAGAEKARVAETAAESAALVREYGLPWESVRSEHRAGPEIWRALLDGEMPIGAMVRNLANMTRLDVLTGEYRQTVVDTLADQASIRKSRIHPVALLLALKTYSMGRGLRGSHEWVPIPAIVDALDEAFYLAFGNVEATGLRILQAVDISGSMDGSYIGGTTFTAREAAAALALVTVNVEADVDTITFSNGGPDAWLPGQRQQRHYSYENAVETFTMTRRQRLDDVIRRMSQLRMGGTDCALPMLWASAHDRDYDAIVVYTDSETWAGTIHPAKALTDYRRKTGIDTKLIVVGMTSNGFSIADPQDPGMLDVVGFDTATPGIMSEFMLGRV